MPPKGHKDIEKRQHEVVNDQRKTLKIENGKIIAEHGTLNSQREASKNYEAKLEQLTVRLPKGSREKLNAYIEQSKEYNSVNSMIKALLEKELGESLD